LKRTLKQQNIIKGARAVIFAKGIEKLTIREIAKELKITNGALYRHFKSKNEIISLLIDDIEENLLSAIQEAASKNGNAMQRLEGILLSHLSYAEQMKGTSFTVINQVSGLKNKYLKKKMLKVLNKYLNTIKSIVMEGVKSGVFKKEINPASVSIMFLGSIQSVVTLWCLKGYAPSLKKAHFSQILNIYKNLLVSK
jgi:AcrR family transcriptional regulator